MHIVNLLIMLLMLCLLWVVLLINRMDMLCCYLVTHPHFVYDTKAIVIILSFNILEKESVECICGILVSSAGGAAVFILSFNILEREREKELFAH